MSRSKASPRTRFCREARLAIPIAAALCLTAGLAHADHEPDFGGPAFYLGASGLGAGYTQLDEALEDALPGIDIDTETAGGFDVFAGFRVHPHFALEAEFEMFPEAEIAADGFGTFAELESWTLMGNLKAYLLHGRTQPYLLLGLGGMQAEIEDTLGLGVRERDLEFAARFGGGVEIYLNEYIALQAGVGYVVPSGDLEDLDYVSFGGGLLLRFPVGD